MHPIPLSCPLLASGLPLLPNRPCKSIRRAGLVAGSGLVRDPVNHGRPQPTRANVPSDPLPPRRCILAGAAHPATWTVRLVRTEYPVQSIPPPASSPPSSHTSAKQQNLARSDPSTFLLFLSFSPHPTDLPNFFFHDLLESGEEGKTALDPHHVLFPPPLVRATSLSSRPCPSQPPLNVYRRLPPPLPDLCFLFSTGISILTVPASELE